MSEFFKKNPVCEEMLSEVVKYIKLFLTIPTSCTAERSFSALRRLKSYLRSTMDQEKLNNIAILMSITKALLILMISQNLLNVLAVRQNTIALKL